MKEDLPRRISNYFLAIGSTGLVGELMLVGTSSGRASGTGTPEILSSRKQRSSHLSTVSSSASGCWFVQYRVAPEINKMRGARPPQILLVLLVGLIGLGGLHVYYFSIGLWGPLDTAIGVLHFFPLFGMHGAALGPGNRPPWTAA